MSPTGAAVQTGPLLSPYPFKAEVFRWRPSNVLPELHFLKRLIETTDYLGWEGESSFAAEAIRDIYAGSLNCPRYWATRRKIFFLGHGGVLANWLAFQGHDVFILPPSPLAKPSEIEDPVLRTTNNGDLEERRVYRLSCWPKYRADAVVGLRWIDSHKYIRSCLADTIDLVEDDGILIHSFTHADKVLPGVSWSLDEITERYQSIGATVERFDRPDRAVEDGLHPGLSVAAIALKVCRSPFNS